MDFDVGSWFSSLSASDWAEIGSTAQTAGVGISAIGAYFSSSGQQTALSTQAGLDAVNARSVYSASIAQSGLDWINAQMSVADTRFRADMSVSEARARSSNMLAQSEIRSAAAQDSAALAGMSAQIDDNQAHLDELMAQSALLHGQWDEQAIRMKTAQAVSQRRTMLAARGVALGYGTAVTVVASPEVEGEMQIARAREGALMSALGHRTSAANSAISGAVKRARGAAGVRQAEMEQSVTRVQATSLTELSIAEADFRKAMADAGLANAKAALDVRNALAEGNLANAQAATDTKRATADSISPWLSATSSLLSGMGSVAESWYRYNKTVGGR